MTPPPNRKRTLDVGPSAAHRWSVCTASPQFILDHADQLPSDRSTFADEGTLAHSVAASMLLDEVVPDRITPEMVAHAKGYADFVKSKFTPTGVKYIERKVPLFYLQQRNGIIDAAIFNSESVVITDLKYGVGVSVEAENNPQIAIYAESLIQYWEDITPMPPSLKVELHIYQPRDRNNHEAVRSWHLTRGELAAYTQGLAYQAQIAMSGQGEFKPDNKACQFCPAKGFCVAYANTGLTALPPEARIIELPHPGALTRVQRVQVLKAKKVLNDWLEAVEDQEFSELMNGAEPQGMKLVEGKANRQWGDPEAALTLLSNHLTMDELRPRADIVSPAQAEKLLKGVEQSTRFKNRMRQLITKPEGKPTLVSEDDPRPALDHSQNNKLEAL